MEEVAAFVRLATLTQQSPSVAWEARDCHESDMESCRIRVFIWQRVQELDLQCENPVLFLSTVLIHRQNFLRRVLRALETKRSAAGLEGKCRWVRVRVNGIFHRVSLRTRINGSV